MFKNVFRKPFKGSIAYEIQVGKFVFMLYYPHSPMLPNMNEWRLGMFKDKYWNKPK